MKKVFYLIIFLSFGLFLFACKKTTNKYLEEYKKLNQEELEKDFIYDSDLNTISGLSEQGQKKEILYFPKNAKRVKKGSIKSNALKEVVFTSNITQIDEYSILQSDNLKTITFLNHFNTIGKIGYDLKSLEKITFLNSKVKEIKNALFVKTPKLSKFEIVNSNLDIKNNQLIVRENNTYKLVYIMNDFNYKFDTSITHILDLVGIFKKVNVKEIEFPKSVKYIGDGVITDAKSLEKITFNLEHLEQFSTNAIQNTNLTEIKKNGNAGKFDILNDTLVSDKKAVLISKNSDFTNLDITEISNYALNKNFAANLDTLKKIITKKINKIGEYAFNGSSNIKGEFDFNEFDNVKDVKNNIFNGISQADLKIKNANKENAWDRNWNKR